MANGQDPKQHAVSPCHSQGVCLSARRCLCGGGGKRATGHIRGDLSSARSPNLGPDLPNSPARARIGRRNPPPLPLSRDGISPANKPPRMKLEHARTSAGRGLSPRAQVAVVSAKATEQCPIPSGRHLLGRASFISLIQAKPLRDWTTSGKYLDPGFSDSNTNRRESAGPA